MSLPSDVLHGEYACPKLSLQSLEQFSSNFIFFTFLIIIL